MALRSMYIYTLFDESRDDSRTFSSASLYLCSLVVTFCPLSVSGAPSEWRHQQSACPHAESLGSSDLWCLQRPHILMTKLIVLPAVYVQAAQPSVAD